MRQRKLFKQAFTNSDNSDSLVELDRINTIDDRAVYMENKLMSLEIALSDTVPPRKKYLIVTAMISKIYSEINGLFSNDSHSIKEFTDKISMLLNKHQVSDEIPLLFCEETRINLACRLRESYTQFALSELSGNLLCMDRKIKISNLRFVGIERPKVGSMISCDNEACSDLILSQEIALRKMELKLNRYKMLISEKMQLVFPEDNQDCTMKDHVKELFGSINEIFDLLKLTLASNTNSYRQARLVTNRVCIIGERLINKSRLSHDNQLNDQAQQLQNDLLDYFRVSCNILANILQFNEHHFSLEDLACIQAIDNIAESIDDFYCSMWQSCKIDAYSYCDVFSEMKKKYLDDLLVWGNHESVYVVKISRFLISYLHEIVEELNIRKHIHYLFSDLKTRIFESVSVEFCQEYIESFGLIDEVINISNRYILDNSTNKITQISLRCFLHFLCKDLAIFIYEANSEKFAKIESEIASLNDEYMKALEYDVEYTLDIVAVYEGYKQKKYFMTNFLKRSHLAMLNLRLVNEAERLEQANQAYHKRRVAYYGSPKNLLTTWVGDEHLLRCVIAAQQETYGKIFSEDASQNVRKMSVAPIRKLYRVLMLKYHPDKTNFLCEDNKPLLQAINQHLNDFSAKIDRIDKGEYFDLEESPSDIELIHEIPPMVVYSDLVILNKIIPSKMHSKLIEDFSVLLNCKFSKIQGDHSSKHIESIDIAISKLSTKAKAMYAEVIKVEKSHVDDLKSQNQEMRDIIQINDLQEQQLDTIRVGLLDLKASQERQNNNIQSVIDKANQNEDKLALLQRQLSELNDSLGAGQLCNLVSENSPRTNKSRPSFFQ